MEAYKTGKKEDYKNAGLEDWKGFKAVNLQDWKTGKTSRLSTWKEMPHSLVAPEGAGGYMNRLTRAGAFRELHYPKLVPGSREPQDPVTS